MKKYIVLATVSAIIATFWIPKYMNNVCKTFEDYYTDRDSNENCYYNPDVELTVPEIVKRNGYPLEDYEVITPDGYILTVFRIPYGKDSNDEKRGKPVFLQHGAHSNSGCFVNVGRKSLAFILADEGYDVWMGNSRGSMYSMNHLNLNYTTDANFWNFSFHEYGAIDLNAELDLVYSLTKRKISYIGYSLGTTAMYVYSSLYPTKAQIMIEMFVNLAPAAHLGEEYLTLPKFASAIWEPFEVALRWITSNGEVQSPYILPVEAVKRLCTPYPFQMKFCLFLHSLVLGSSFANHDPETLPITLIHNNDKGSVKLWAHMAQLWYHQTFKHFDYGEETNLNYYGTIAPPEYNLSKITIPMYFIRAKSDLLTTEKDTIRLYDALPKNNKPKHIYIVEDGYGHNDLLVAKNVVPLVHDEIVRIIKLHP